MNPQVFKFMASGGSQRMAARLLQINRKTVIRKFIFMALWAHHYFQIDRAQHSPITHLEFDDLETFEHSKMKPLSVSIAVESRTRRILGFRVASMPAKGLLARPALKKYGRRADNRAYARQSLFAELKSFVKVGATIRSDQNPHYPIDVKKFFPTCQHVTTKGRRGCVVGQGELKAGGFDPMFSLNHTYAMHRAHINRLFRRTWNTTKKPERLAMHLAIYALFHNLELLQRKVS